MIKLEKQEHKNLIEKTVEHLEAKGYENIKVDLNGYEKPKSFLMKSKNIEVTPDIVAETEGKKHYIELGIKSDKTSLLKSKWKFLEALAEIKDRRFRIVAHRGHYGFTKNLIDEIGLAKVPVKI